jgi:hypothetical protein
MDDVCGAVKPFVAAGQESPSLALNDVAETRQRYSTYFGQLSTEATAALKRLRGIDGSSIPGGAELIHALKNQMTKAASNFSEFRAMIDKTDPAPDALAVTLAQIGAAAGSSVDVNPVRSVLSANPGLASAATRSVNCRY